MTVLFNSLRSGTNGVSVSTANSAGTDGSNAFDLVNIGSTGTLAYSNAHVLPGRGESLSAQFQSGGTPAPEYLQWAASMGNQSELWFRMYLYFLANPTLSTRVIQWLSGASAAGGIVVTAAGKLQALNSAGSGAVISTGTIPLNAWFRLEGFIIGSATVGQVGFSWYNTIDSVTPTETDTSPATVNTTGVLGTSRFGIANAVTSQGPYFMADLALSNTGSLGPSQFSGSATASLILAASARGARALDPVGLGGSMIDGKILSGSLVNQKILAGSLASLNNLGGSIE
jgi:hypothetical protein